MHRLAICAFSTLSLVVAGCGGGKPPAHPSKAETASADATNDESGAKDASEGGEKGAAGEGAKKNDCIGFDIPSLEDTLVKSACELPNARPDSVPTADLKGKVDVTVSSSPTKVAPGGKADLVVAIVNKTKAPIVLDFRIDPTARFEVEVYDAKGKRVDMPKGDPPSPKNGESQPGPAEPKVARITVAANGSARQIVPWQAVRMAWAPEKVRGTPMERGFPRKPAGPLPKGKYTVKVVTPLVGVEGEIGTPKVEIDVG